MKRLFKILVLIVAMMLIISIIKLIFNSLDQRKEMEGVKIEEVREPAEPVEETPIISVPKKEKEIVKIEEVREPAEPVEETPIISVPKKEKEAVKKTEEETPKAVETAKTERRDVEKEEITATEPAAETKTAEDAQDIKEITGLITEETMTNTGYKFYENFCLLWKAPEEGVQVKGYSISISEKANPSWGSWIQVSVNAKMSQTIIWSDVIRPGPEEVAEAVKKAVEATKEYLVNYETYQKQLKGIDMSGDGIY